MILSSDFDEKAYLDVATCSCNLRLFYLAASL